MIPNSVPLDEFLHDPEAGRARLGRSDLIVVSATEWEAQLIASERTRFVSEVRESLRSLDRGEGTSVDELQARLDAEDSADERAA